jgi:hypothetical protein
VRWAVSCVKGTSVLDKAVHNALRRVLELCGIDLLERAAQTRDRPGVEILGVGNETTTRCLDSDSAAPAERVRND